MALIKSTLGVKIRLIIIVAKNVTLNFVLHMIPHMPGVEWNHYDVAGSAQVPCSQEDGQTSPSY